MRVSPRVGPAPRDTSGTRRGFLRGLAGLTVVAAAAPARLLADTGSERVLSLANTHTGERLTIPYFADGDYLPGALARLEHHLRDHRNGAEHPMDPVLFDILNDLRLATGTRAPFQVISGYRSPKTNAKLRAAGRGVAKRSLHMDGRAIDVRLADVKTSVLRDAALELRRGGVGYYRKSDFVHVDTGRFRTW
ncbi:MAG: DUF882 domain-containing protein [Acidobacteria bacterium]|jgi:uncharacterized protein YcbK (DUF882 family)|nr:DUF882 domain-containing protein [Acidobacteriota bacterium]